MRCALSSLLALFASAAFANEPATPGPTGDIPVMREEAQAAGLDSVYDGGFEFFVGGGGAALDCDRSGYPSLFLAGGRNPAKLYQNQSERGGKLAFIEKPILSAEDQHWLRNVTGAYPLDIDGDGFTDLVVLRYGGNLLLKGGPQCTFTVANTLWRFEPPKAWGTAFSARWEKDARFPSLAFGYYIDQSAPGAPWGTCENNALYRPQPRENPEYSVKTELSPGFCALSMLFTDWNRSGVASLRISNDRQYYRGGAEQLWRLPPGRLPALYSPGDGWKRFSIFGMGIAAADLDGDGYPVYALTSMGDTKLQKLEDAARNDPSGAAPVYRDIAFERGATAHRPYSGGDLRPSTGWHAEFADFNNDTLLDLFIAKGNVEQMPDFAAFDPNNLLLGQFNGKFIEAGAAAGIAINRKGRGAIITDFNLDGQLDLLVINRGTNVSLFRNLGAARRGGGEMPMGNWLGVKLKQTGTNPAAGGAVINIKTGTKVQTRSLSVGGGHVSGYLGWSHVGLGTAERAEIRVTWPDGEQSPPYRVFGGQFVVIERGAKAASYWYPGR